MVEVLPQQNKKTVLDAVSCLQEGGVVLLPTDTVLGLAVLPENLVAVERLFNLKARPRGKELPIMVANLEQLDSLGVIASPDLKKLLNSPLVPGGLTLVANLNSKICPKWLQGRKEIAFRIPKFELLTNILEQTGPLLVTSANLAGSPTPRIISEVLKQLNGEPDLVVNGKMVTDTPSTLVNCTKSLCIVERVGTIPLIELSKWVVLQNG